MTTDEIKAAIAAGKTVYWGNPAYEVIQENSGKLCVYCALTNYTAPFEGRDAAEFYVGTEADIHAAKQALEADARRKFVATLRAGQTYELAPHADLWMRGAKSARIKRVYRGEGQNIVSASVAPIINGQEVRGTFRISVDHFATPTRKVQS